MTSLRGISTNIPHERLASSSQPPSPNEEADISKAVWDDEDTKTLVHSTHKGKGKGKGKERAVEQVDDDDTETLTGDSIKDTPVNYPPMTEEEMESRKVEENLKRWEILEKQRRKRARETRSGSFHTDFPESLVSVGRAGQQLFTGASRDKKTNRRDSTESHQNSDRTTSDRNSTLLQSLPNSPNRTPRNSVFQTDNPFENPDYTVTGMISLNSPPQTPDPDEPNSDDRKKSAKKGKKNQMEPPRPLDLPPPITALSAEEQRLQLEMERETRRNRWWTEWLCGCREEGEEQAGRTNPME